MFPSRGVVLTIQVFIQFENGNQKHNKSNPHFYTIGDHPEDHPGYEVPELHLVDNIVIPHLVLVGKFAI